MKKREKSSRNFLKGADISFYSKTFIQKVEDKLA